MTPCFLRSSNSLRNAARIADATFFSGSSRVVWNLELSPYLSAFTMREKDLGWNLVDPSFPLSGLDSLNQRMIVPSASGSALSIRSMGIYFSANA